MDALALAKRRSRRLRREQGAAMFVVSMTIVALASVGLYALAAAQTEIRTSGNERQRTQTHYLAQYGVIGVTHEMVATKAQLYLGLMLNSSTIDTPCVSLPGVPVTASILTRACRRMGAQELGASWVAAPTTPYTGNVPFAANTTPGSLGPAPMNADFFVELTDPNETSTPPRYSTDLHFCFVQLTATSNGITQPLFPSSANPTGTFGAEGIEMQRARILAGPVQCPR
jgi:hypothetical protein